MLQNNDDQFDEFAGAATGGTSDNSWWEQAAADIRNDPDSLYCENLQTLEQSMAQRVAVRDRLFFCIEEIKNKLDATVESTAANLAGQLYEQYACSIQQQQVAILELVQSNHATRVRMVHVLDEANENWQSNYTNLMSRVVFGHQSDSLPDAKKDGSGAVAQDNNKDAKKSPPDPQDSNKVDGSIMGDEFNINKTVAEPDWDEVIRFAPHVEENIRTFLEARNKWKLVEEQYVQAMEGHHERLQANIDGTLNLLFETFQALDENLDEQQYSVQKLVASNHERRQQLQQALEESALQAQGMFARLMARVSSLRPNKQRNA
jgi:hypothetical protein